MGLVAPLTASSLSSSPIPSPSFSHSSKPFNALPSVKVSMCGGVGGSKVKEDSVTVFVGLEARRSLYDRNDKRFITVFGEGDGESSRAMLVGDGGPRDDVVSSNEALGDGLRLTSGLTAGVSTSTSTSPACESTRIAAAESRTDGTEFSVGFPRGIR